jgi:3'-phosphoadenosine 5'-phosphosulfate sulfotransferase (PAPS reductase)/FAD synthetase
MTEITIISLGAGTQSSALAVLAALGKVTPRPIAAVFADTGCEWPETYDFFHLLREWLEKHGLPVAVVSAGDMYEFFLNKRLLPVAFGGPGRNGRRQCTDKFKIRPVKRWLRDAGADRARVMLGISMEESNRASRSPDQWITNAYPLVEMRWTRTDCLKLLLDLGFPEPPKSRCWICPMQPMSAWRVLASRHPELFAKAVMLEEAAMARRMEVGKQPLTLTGGPPLQTLFSVSQPTLL